MWVRDRQVVNGVFRATDSGMTYFAVGPISNGHLVGMDLMLMAHGSANPVGTYEEEVGVVLSSSPAATAENWRAGRPLIQRADELSVNTGQPLLQMHEARRNAPPNMWNFTLAVPLGGGSQYGIVGVDGGVDAFAWCCYCGLVVERWIWLSPPAPPAELEAEREE